MHRSLCVGVILCLVSAIGVGSVFRTVEYRTMEATDEQRLLWVTGMVQSKWWFHERVFAQMLAFDPSTEEGMGKFKDFNNKVKREVQAQEVETTSSPHLPRAMVQRLSWDRSLL